MKSKKVKAAAKWAKIKQNRQEEGNGNREVSPDMDEILMEESSDEDQLSENDAVDQESSEEEVLPISGDDSDEDNDEEDLPNRDAWGQKKSMYFNADFVDEDRGKTYREEDAEMAKAEAEEALAIQRSVMSYVNASNLDRDLLLKAVEESIEDEEQEKEEVIEESTALTKQEKLRKLKKTTPEFYTYSKEFKEKMLEIAEKLEPCFKAVESGRIPAGNVADYIIQKYHVTYQYCLNIASYMMLKSSGSLFSNHAVHHWINVFKNHLETLNDKFNCNVEDIDKLLKKVKRSDKITLNMSMASTKSKSAKNTRTNLKVEFDSNIPEQSDDNDDLMTEEVMTDGKRNITYQIAKNKGLTAPRRKELRNPRVHNRMKFKKAKARRKGQVRDIIREIKKYEGEPTGISSHVVKSVKFK